MWNLSVYIDLCFTTKSFTVSSTIQNNEYIFSNNDLFSYLHKRRERIYYITALKKINEAEADLNITQSDLDNRSSTNDLDKRTYLKILERSVRTGRRIQDEKDDKNYYINNSSQSSSFFFLRRFINQHLTPTTTMNSIQRSTDI